LRGLVSIVPPNFEGGRGIEKKTNRGQIKTPGERERQREALGNEANVGDQVLHIRGRINITKGKKTNNATGC